MYFLYKGEEIKALLRGIVQWTENLCLLKSHMLKPNPQCHGIRKGKGRLPSEHRTTTAGGGGEGRP